MRKAFIFSFVPFIWLSLELYSMVWCALVLPIVSVLKHIMRFVFQFVSIVGIPKSMMELFYMTVTLVLIPFRFFLGLAVLTARNACMAYDVCVDIYYGEMNFGDLPYIIEDAWEINNCDFLSKDLKTVF